MVKNGLAAPQYLGGLYLEPAYGRIRDALIAALEQHGAWFGSHDPDGHLSLVQRSQTS